MMLHSDINKILARQQAAFAADPYPTRNVRAAHLRTIETLIDRHGVALCDAIAADFGHRPAQESWLTELFVVRSEARHARAKLGAWMRRRHVATALHFLPSRGFIFRQPIGVVGVISPWNYPVQLALTPMVAALAAGNRVMLKPSELTPATSALIAELIAAHFDPEWVSVVQGDSDLSARFARLRFDHLFFTGSTAVGRKVAMAAAANLVPVTLELGGKSPALIEADADIDQAAARIAHGKLLNAGQTCVAPDYVLVPHDRCAEFITAYRRSAQQLYPPKSARRDYGAVLNARYRDRLAELVTDARSGGARIEPVLDSDLMSDGQVAPLVVFDPPHDSAIMKEEIFGPHLPIIPYSTPNDAMTFIADRPRPLALYWFGRDRARRNAVLRQSHAGGVTINGTIWHMAQANLPFGGVGDSGYGAYHGEAGFLRFSQEKAVFIEHSLSAMPLIRPPFGKVFNATRALLEFIS
jgi:coniferyl-aldehyde dehydrogenase